MALGSEIFTRSQGRSVGPDRSLWYAKGGWASSRLTQTSNEITHPIFGTVSHQASGWTVGAGVEYRLTSWPNFSVGLDYDYIRLGASDTSACTSGAPAVFSCPAPAQPLLFNGFHADINEVLVRLNYTFNWVAPIVTRN
jgi:opacity protein-like surface antigen